MLSSVIPAKAGIQEQQALLAPGDPVPAKAGSRGDAFGDFLRTHYFFLQIFYLQGEASVRLASP
jgi:hypothetical protein